MSEQGTTKPMFRAKPEPGFTVPVRWRIQRRTWYGWKSLPMGSSSFAISETDAQEMVNQLQAAKPFLYPQVPR